MTQTMVKIGKKVLKIKRDRAHTSKRGCLPAVRAIFNGSKPISRAELVASMVKKFGPKAAFAVMNYIGEVKKGKLPGVEKKWVEDDEGVLRPKKSKVKNGKAKK
jgi:hypothetical protein